MSTITQALEIRNAAGTALGVVINHYDGEWIQAVNSADRLTFRCPYSEATNLVYPNEIWLRRGDDATLVRKFLITVVESIEGRRTEVHVTAYDYSSMLLRVPVSEYPTGDEPEGGLVDTAEYLAGLLTLAASTGITCGTLPVLTAAQETQPYNEMHTTDSNVLAALHNVRQNIGGMLWVDNDKRLHWYIERFPAAPSYALELDRNCIEVRKRTDDTTNRTRTEFDVEVVDLSAHDTTDDGMWMIGMPVAVPVPNSSSTETLYITDIRQRLDNPLATEISVNSVLDTTGRFRDAIDYLLEDIDATNRTDTWIEQIDDWHYEIDDWLDGADTDYETIDDWFVDELDNPSEEVTDAIEEIIEDVLTDPTQDVQDAFEETLVDVLTDPSQDVQDAVEDVLDKIGAVIMRKAKVSALNADGNNIDCYLWDSDTSAWEATTTSVLKPYDLRKSTYSGNTITYTDGTSVTYSATGVTDTYERVADYGGAETETQSITSPYAVDEVLQVYKDGANWADLNTAGRHWAAEEEEGT